MNALLDKNVIQRCTGLRRRSGNGFDCARHLRFAAGGARAERPNQSAEYCGTVLGAQPDYYFGNAGEEEIYIGSAAGCRATFTSEWKFWCLLRDNSCASGASRILILYWRIIGRRAFVAGRDVLRAWQPMHGKRNRKAPTGAAAFSAQDYLISVAEGKQSNAPRCGSGEEAGFRWEGKIIAMIIYFLRHASAGEPLVNPKKDEKRALDKEGIEQCGYVGRALAAIEAQVDVIISSR